MKRLFSAGALAALAAMSMGVSECEGVAAIPAAAINAVHPSVSLSLFPVGGGRMSEGDFEAGPSKGVAWNQDVEVTRNIAVEHGTVLMVTAAATSPTAVRTLYVEVSRRSPAGLWQVVHQRQIVKSAEDKDRNPCSVPSGGCYGAKTLRVLTQDGSSDPIEIEVIRDVRVRVVALSHHKADTILEVTATPLKAIDMTLATDKMSVEPGEPYAVTWDVDNANIVLMQTNGGPWKKMASHAGTTSSTVSPATIRLEATTMWDGEVWERATAMVHVDQHDPPPPPPPDEPETLLGMLTTTLVGQGAGDGQWRPHVRQNVGFGVTGFRIVSIRNLTGPVSPVTIRLVKAGYSTNDCGNPSAVVILPYNDTTTASEMAMLFPGIATPVDIVACVDSATPGTAVNPLVQVTYEYLD